MSDDWLKDSEQRREQRQAESGPPPDKKQLEAAARAFYDEHSKQVAGVLADVGELWKSLDPHKATLGVITTHIGHDYRVKINEFQFTALGVELFLFDKNNMGWIHNLPGCEASVRVLIHRHKFDIYVNPGLILEQAPSLDGIKSVLAKLWGKGKIVASAHNSNFHHTSHY